MKTRLVLFPSTESLPSVSGGNRTPTSFVAALAVRYTWPHYHFSPDPHLVTRFLISLLPPQSLFIMVLQRGVDRRTALAYLDGRSLAYRVKQEPLDVEDGAAPPLLSRLWRRRIMDFQVVFRSAASDDLEWAVRRYGSLDRLRIFAVSEAEAEATQEWLALPSSDVAYDMLLDRVAFIGLFDYDWEYFFCFSRRMSATQLINDFRTVCLGEGVEAETAIDPALLGKVTRHAEALVGHVPRRGR